MQDIIIRELKGYQEISIIFPLIVQLNTDMDEVTFSKCLKEMIREGYRCIGAFTHDGKLVGCSGFWIGTRFWCGPFIEPENLIIDRDHRRSGIGEKLMAWIEAEGRRHNCQIVKLEAYASNAKTRAFYASRAYEEPGLVITKPLAITAEQWQEKLEKKAR